jgi:hypothetical protein
LLNAAAAPAADGESKLLAGKFKSAEDLEKSYLELQRKLVNGRSRRLNPLPPQP